MMSKEGLQPTIPGLGNKRVLGNKLYLTPRPITIVHVQTLVRLYLVFMRKKGGDSTHIQIWIMCKMIAKENNREREREKGEGKQNNTDT